MALLERERELALVGDALRAAACGEGSAVVIAGEPGVGKTSLVAAACDSVTGLRVLRGGCDPLSTPRPLGPLRDLSELAVEAGASPAGVCDTVFAALRGTRGVLVVEDLHWVDAASVEVLRFLVRRLDVLPTAVVLTYRDDEIGPHHPLRPLLGDLAARNGVVSVRLGPLSRGAVGDLLGDRVLDVDRVHAVTGGNPFFVTQIARHPGLPVPPTVRDAVLARVSHVDPSDFEVLQLAAAAPEHLDDRVLPVLGVDLPTLRRLYDTGLLQRDRRGLVFRHELARLAVEGTIPAGGGPALHGRLVEAMESLVPYDPAALTHHAVAAGDAPRILRYAEEAAQEAVRAGAHTEAAAFLRTALDHLTDADPGERARLQVWLGIEQYMTSDLDVAIQLIERTFPLWRRVQDANGLATALESCAVFEYYNAHRPAAEQHADLAVSLTSDLSGKGYGSARATRAYLAYHRSDFTTSLSCSADALRIAAETGDEALEIRGLLVRAVSDLATGVAGARERCLDLVDRARQAQLDELASTGYSNVAYLDVEQTRLREAERLLETSLPYTIERDIPICNHWQTAVRARLRLRAGRWDAALEDAADTLAREGMPLAKFWPSLVSGLAELRRDGDGADHIDRAWLLARKLDEPLRIVPVLAALAERRWLSGTDDFRLTDGLHFPDLDRATLDNPALAWSLGELAVWAWRSGLRPPIDPEAVAEPHRLTLAGRPEEAAAWWQQSGAVYEAALALLDAPDPERRADGIVRLDLLGATAIADRARQHMRDLGMTQVPARPRTSTRTNPAGLTNRQLDVAKLVARGLTNGEIAARLFISARTTDHHVSAVLAKLGMPSRRAVVKQAVDLGLS